MNNNENKLNNSDNKLQNIINDIEDAHSTFQERILSKDEYDSDLTIDISKPLTIQEVMDILNGMKR